MDEEHRPPVLVERPRGRLLAGALLGSLAVVGALLATASAGAGDGPTIDRSVVLGAERNATPAQAEASSGPAFTVELCVKGTPYRWEGDERPDFSFKWDLDGLDQFEKDPDGTCDATELGGFGRLEAGKRPSRLFDMTPDFEAFEACLADQGVDPDAKPDWKRRKVVIAGPEGRTVVEFGDDIGSVTVTGTDEDVEITTEGGATVVDVEAQERARREAVATCKGDLPGHGGKFGFDLGFGEPFEGPFGKAPHGLFEEFFGEFFEEFELEVESFGLDADELRRERRADARRDLLRGVAGEGGRCETSQSV